MDDMKLIEDVSILKKGKLILYGAGEQGERISNLLQNMGIEQAYFCDSDEKKWGRCINHVEIISPIQLQQISEECHVIVIITTKFVSEIVVVLEKIGIEDIYTIFALEYALLLHLETGFFTDEEVNWFQWKKACYCSQERYTHFIKKLIECTKILREEETPVLVYQSGKVGSMTVYKSICKYKPTVHVHMLSRESIEKHSGSNLAWNKNLRFLYQCVQDEVDRKNIKIITLVRDPVANMLSRFFQFLSFGAWATENPPFKFCFDNGLSSLYDVFDYFIEDSINPETQVQLQYGVEFDWFNKELKEVFGVDIYETAFNKSEGYYIVSKGNVEVLCMQLEKMDNLKDVMRGFLGIPELELETVNMGDESAYKYAYSTFRKQVKIPTSVLDFYYKDNEAMNHFYTDEDIQSFRKKWKK